MIIIKNKKKIFLWCLTLITIINSILITYTYHYVRQTYQDRQILKAKIIFFRDKQEENYNLLKEKIEQHPFAHLLRQNKQHDGLLKDAYNYFNFDICNVKPFDVKPYQQLLQCCQKAYTKQQLLTVERDFNFQQLKNQQIINNLKQTILLQEDFLTDEYYRQLKNNITYHHYYWPKIKNINRCQTHHFYFYFFLVILVIFAFFLFSFCQSFPLWKDKTFNKDFFPHFFPNLKKFILESEIMKLIKKILPFNF